MATNEQILSAIQSKLALRPTDPSICEDYFSCIRNMTDAKADLTLSAPLKAHLSRAIREAPDPQTRARLWETQRRLLCYEAPESFDSFMLYCEIDRPLNEQFWLPRRKHMMPVALALQEMETGPQERPGRLDELFLPMPPRVGKTTIVQFFLEWVMGRNSERSNLYSSYTDSVVKVFYNGILEVLNDPTTYRYFDIFPESKIASTDAKDYLINLDRKKKYASFTARSLWGTLNGACDCNGYIIADDLISGIEEAMNKERLRSAWRQVQNNLIPRAKENAKIIWIGTRWSLIDPQGTRIDLLENDEENKSRRWKVLSTPALNEQDESNFDYAYGVGYSTKYYRERRASFERDNDMASWMAQYQNEPIEREGSLFTPESLRYYNGVLPDGAPDRIFMAIDPAWGGGDYTAGPVCVQYGDDIYIPDVVFDNGDKTITQPLIVSKIEKHGVQAVKVEGTKMTASYGEDIDKVLRSHGKRINMQINTSHFEGKGKRQRIYDKAPDIRERMIFLEQGHRSKEYSLFMNNMYSFTITGKEAKHDDAADACAMAIDFATLGYPAKAEVVESPLRW